MEFFLNVYTTFTTFAHTNMHIRENSTTGPVVPSIAVPYYFDVPVLPILIVNKEPDFINS